MMRLLLACMSIVLLASNVELNRSRRRKYNVGRELSIFEDDLCDPPNEYLGVEQGGIVVNFGTNVLPADTQYAPTVEYNNAADDCLYTIVIVDTCNSCCCSDIDNVNNENSNRYSDSGPGCTTCGIDNGSNNKLNGGSNNKFNGGFENNSNVGSDCISYLLALYVNVPANYLGNLEDLNSDCVARSYVPPCFIAGREVKEIMVVLYQQEAECDVAALQNCQREGFNTCDYAKNNSLSLPLAGNYYRTDIIYDFEEICAKLLD